MLLWQFFNWTLLRVIVFTAIFKTKFNDDDHDVCYITRKFVAITSAFVDKIQTIIIFSICIEC